MSNVNGEKSEFDKWLEENGIALSNENLNLLKLAWNKSLSLACKLVRENEGTDFEAEAKYRVPLNNFVWSYDENENAIRIFRGYYQIVKIPKKGTPHTEYYPNKQRMDWIISALNEYEKVNPMWKDE